MKTSKLKTKISHIVKKHKFLLRSIAVTLVLTLLFTSMPMDGIIALGEQIKEESELITVVKELEQYRTGFTKTYIKNVIQSSNDIANNIYEDDLDDYVSFDFSWISTCFNIADSVEKIAQYISANRNFCGELVEYYYENNFYDVFLEGKNNILYKIKDIQNAINRL